MDITSQLSEIKGIGPKNEKLLNDIGIFCIKDLLIYFPRDYENISVGKKIMDTYENEKILIKGKVLKINKDIRTKNNKTISTIELNDGTSVFKAKWFNQPYMKNKFIINEEFTLKGTVKSYKNEKILLNPTMVNSEFILDKKIQPIYPLKSGITNSMITKYISEVLRKVFISENLPEWIVNKYELCSLDDAIKNIHSPENYDKLVSAKRRIKFQELFTYSLKVLMLKEFINKDKNGISFSIADEIKTLKQSLPFTLTNGQCKVLREILLDQKKPLPMNRLIQGDVGCGKTIVAIISILNVVKNGYQAAFMAPTETLAFQHFYQATELLKNFDINIAILSGSLSAKEKKVIKEELKKGEIDIIIGTHALLEEDVVFNNLGLVVTDEQHRFGVMQRSKLFNKRTNIDILVMTATPIPRTLSLYLYGDLDVSIINELPPGRQKINTSYINYNQKEKAYLFSLEKIKRGHQVYIICPLIEENEGLSISSVENIYKYLTENYFKDYNVEILHGKMQPKIKNEIMSNFKEGKIDVLIATTVIEVGIDVPNASVIIIENAERFGLAQLHQLRGRVGRGKDKAYCILIGDTNNKIAKQRMEIMKKSNDGFYISEQDLMIRGSGEIFGIKQSGENEFILADIMKDINILKAANHEAKELLKSNKPEDLRIKNEIYENIEKNSRYICFN